MRQLLLFLLLLGAAVAVYDLGMIDGVNVKFIDLLELEDFNDTAFDVAENFVILGGQPTKQRLQKRNYGMAAGKRPDPVVLQFDSGVHHFVIRLREHQNILSDFTVLRIHREEKGAVASKPVLGTAYVGDRLVVLDKQRAASIYGNNATTLIELEEQPGIFVSDSPFGRFYIDRSGIYTNVNGGFSYDGQFIRVQNALHPVARQAVMARQLRPTPDTEAKGLNQRLVLSLQNLTEAGSFGASSKGGRKYKCGHDHMKFNREPQGAPSFFAKLLAKEGTSNHPTDDGSSGKKLYARSGNSGCPATEKVLYVGVVADCAYMEAFKMDAAQAQANIISDFNLVSSIYEEAFNVHLGILSIDLMMECAGPSSQVAFNKPCSTRMGMDEKLNLFTKWRANQTADAGLYHLVSGCSASEIVGIAWLNQVCQPKPYVDSNGDSVAGTSVSVFIKNQFAVMAHEFGHNFGAVHDCDSQTCRTCSGSDCQCCPCGSACDCRAQYVMNSESGGLNVKKFSECTVDDVCQKIPVLAPCLKEPGTFRTISAATCGNGIRDEGEECDCGGPEKCKDHPCCTEECKLKSKAVCSDNNDRCCKDCQIIPGSANHVCIPSKGLCQKASVCDGKDRDCPSLETLPDGADCGEELEGGQCASGMCTSRSKQCAAVGARLGLTEACPYEFGSCSIVCKSGNGCVMLDATFVNGTPCGYSGRCYAGECSEPAYQTFIMRNVVPLGVVIGGILFVVLLMVGNSIISAYRSRG